MPTIPTVRKSAPYIYLTKGQEEPKYSIFVRIPLLPGTVAVRTGTPNTLPLTFRVEDGTNPNGDSFYTHENIDPPTQSPLLGQMEEQFDIQEDVLSTPIVVEVKHEATISDGDTKPTYKVAVPFSDADTANAPTVGADKIARNCPYVYLTNPNAEIGNSDPDYAPRCHIPLEAGIGFQTSTVDNSVNGKYIETIRLHSNGSADPEVSPTQILANAALYTDDGRKTGFFQVIIPPIVTQAGTKPARKGNLPNRSSDTNPNNFM